MFTPPRCFHLLLPIPFSPFPETKRRKKKENEKPCELDSDFASKATPADADALERHESLQMWLLCELLLLLLQGDRSALAHTLRMHAYLDKVD